MNAKKIAPGDIGVTLYVLCAFIFLIVPIPSIVLDIALAINMAIAFAVIFCLFNFKKNNIILIFTM